MVQKFKEYELYNAKCNKTLKTHLQKWASNMENSTNQYIDIDTYIQDYIDNI